MYRNAINNEKEKLFVYNNIHNHEIKKNNLSFYA